MRLTLLAFGTRGDVTPFAALGSRLRAAGHTVRLATHAEFELLADAHGLEFRPVPGSFQDFIASREGRRALGVPRCSPFGVARLLDPFLTCAEAVYCAAWEASADADGIVSSAVAWPVASLIAARRAVPLALGQVVPATPTRAMPHPVFHPWPLGAFYNRATYVAGYLLIGHRASAILDRWQREADRLSDGDARREVKTVTLIAVSPHVVARPPDWPPEVHVTGYWFPPKGADSMIPDRVRSFIENGPPPICLGFGSMTDDDPRELRAIVLEALEQVGLRAVVVGGSGCALMGVESRRDVCEVSFVDYDWLFSRVTAVVHQGGAGTASYCLTAGVPQVIVRYCLDHNFWAWRMRKLGVAPPSLLRQTLRASALADGIRLVIEDPSFRRRAQALAPLIRAEDGLVNAAEILTAHFGH